MDSDLARRRAAEAERLSSSSPYRARELATQARRLARQEHDERSLVVAERALGLAARELNELGAARRHLQRSLALAEKCGLAGEAARTRGRLAYVISLLGDTDEALAGIASEDLATTGLARAQVQVQRALVLQRAGKDEAAFEQYRRAIPVLRRNRQYLDEVRARSNRSVLYTYRGNYAAAEADLRRAAELAPLVGEGLITAKIHHNLGFVAASRGKIPEALSWFDRAQEEFATLGQSQAPVLGDRCEALLSVGLASEGFEAAQQAVKELEQSGSAVDLAEARLMAARAALLTGELSTARTNARRARNEFRRQSRPGWEALADYVIARATIAGPKRGMPASIDEVASKLAGAGWLTASIELRLSWAIASLSGSQHDEAIRQLHAAATYRKERSAILRSHGWHAEALLRRERGDASVCRAALRSGLRVLDTYHAALGATELQVHAASNAKDLAALGCRLAVEEGSPKSVLEWAERWRAGALRHRPATPSGGPEIERLLEDLRHLSAQMDAAALEGRPTERHLRRLGGLESAIRDATRRASGTPTTKPTRLPILSDLRRALGDRVLVEFVMFDNLFHAVTVSKRRVRLHRLAPLDEVQREADSLRFSFSRLARGRGSRDTIGTFAAAARHAAGRLEDLLLGGITCELGNAGVIIVPTGRLHHLPWSALESLRHRTVSVAPSAAVWYDAYQRCERPSKARVVLVAGPGLPHAEQEVQSLRAIYPGATVLTGEAATATRVASALDGATLAHIAAHGTFRSDNPQFSALHLYDGRLTVHDLDLLHHAPEVMILSSCESGLNAVRPGDELLGLSAAVLSLGTTNLMASVVPVPDRTTARFMVAVHEQLARRLSPPNALATARDEFPSTEDAEAVTTAGFVCFGA